MTLRGGEPWRQQAVTTGMRILVSTRPSAIAMLALLLAPGLAASAALDGRAIAQGQERGNCLACHRMPADPLAVTDATLGPILQAVRKRYPDRLQLRAQIWDPAVRNPETLMPRYGRHRILTDAEIDAVTDYVFGL